jgi:UDP-N-acetylmuramoylalanine--D-glutamate ligase
MVDTNNVYSQLAGKKVAIIGLGIEGAALCDFLIDKVSHITVLEKLDLAELKTKVDPELYTKIAKVVENEKIKKIFGETYMDSLNDFDIIFRSPSFYFADPRLLAAKASGVKISSQIDLFFDLCPCQIVGVTGTKGKGTTATIIFEILKQDTRNKIQETNRSIYLAGNIGYPAITLIPEIKNDDIVILELSNFQLADLEKSPHVAVVTNIYVDHRDYHKSTEEYHAAKFNILAHQKEGDIAILNKESTFGISELAHLKSKILYYGSTDENAVVQHNMVILDPSKRNIGICNISDINLFGQHNLENIAAATLAADSLGVDPKIISSVVKEFVGLPHRLELVRELSGIKFINDSFATNPEPTIAAIKSFDDNKVLILGGSSKQADFRDLATAIVTNNVKAVVLIGDEAARIKSILLSEDYSGNIIEGAHDIDAAVLAAYNAVDTGEVVILSPACASFGMFRNYKDRGDKFRTAVLNLSKK